MNGTVEIILIPEMVTEANKKVVIPPRADAGMTTSAAAYLEKIPMRIKKKQAAYPAFLLAQRVRAITPLFCAKVDIGVIVHKQASMPFIPSTRTPP